MSKQKEYDDFEDYFEDDIEDDNFQDDDEDDSNDNQPITKSENKVMKEKEKTIKRKEPGDIVNNIYKIIEKIGVGGNAVVYLAENTKTKQQYALKEIQKNKNSLSFIENEIKIGLYLYDSPYICKQKETHNDEDFFYIFFEYSKYGDLFDFLTTQHKTDGMSNHKKLILTDVIIDLTKNIIYDLCMGLKYCHEKRICHNDIKPENILIFDNENGDTKSVRHQIYKLTDLGRSTDGRKYHYNHIGTRQYSAPETFFNEGVICYKSDMWSVGIVMFILLTAMMPFKSENFAGDLEDQKTINDIIATVIQYQHKDEPEKTKYKNAINLMRQLLQLNPNKRITAEQALNHPFLKY